MKKIRKNMKKRNWILSLSLIVITGFSIFSSARVTIDQQLENSFERTLKRQQESLLSLLREAKSMQNSWNSNSVALQNDFNKVLKYWKQDLDKIKDLKKRLQQCESQ